MCIEFFYVLLFSHFLMDLDFRFASHSELYERKESSKTRKRAQNSLKERSATIIRKIQNTFLDPYPN